MKMCNLTYIYKDLISMKSNWNIEFSFNVSLNGAAPLERDIDDSVSCHCLFSALSNERGSDDATRLNLIPTGL